LKKFTFNIPASAPVIGVRKKAMEKGGRPECGAAGRVGGATPRLCRNPENTKCPTKDL